MNGISVIICCYNSERTIKRTLEHLSTQNNLQNISWEIIIVDNNCSDKTAEIVLLFKKEHPKMNIHLVHEPQPGLIFARNMGINTALYDIIQFCDDDNFLFENYLSTMWNIMQNEKIGACGGKGIAMFDSGTIVPDWFYTIQASYACGEQSNGTRYVTALYGAGLCVRKSILSNIKQLGLKYMLTGRNGNLQLSGDDTELCCFIRKMGFQLYYTPTANFYHCLSSSRLNIEYAQKMFYGFGVAIPVIDLYNNVFHNYHITYRHLYKQLVKSIRDYYILRLKKRNKNVYRLLDVSVAKGKVNGYLKFSFKKLIHQYTQFKMIPNYVSKNQTTFT